MESRDGESVGWNGSYHQSWNGNNSSESRGSESSIDNYSSIREYPGKTEEQLDERIRNLIKQKQQRDQRIAEKEKLIKDLERELGLVPTNLNIEKSAQPHPSKSREEKEGGIKPWEYFSMDVGSVAEAPQYIDSSQYDTGIGE